jgi:membrane-associated phospholipid phosphatase
MKKQPSPPQNRRRHTRAHQRSKSGARGHSESTPKVPAHVSLVHAPAVKQVPSPSPYAFPIADVLQAVMTGARLKASLSTSELCTLVTLAICTILDCIWYGTMENALMFIIGNISLMWLQCVLATTESERTPRPLVVARYFFLVPAIYFIYAQVHLLVRLANPHDMDTTLAAWDYALFGVNPSAWLHAFAHPALTELMQISYALFFLVPILLPLEFFLTRSKAILMRYLSVIAIASYLLYVGYMFLPAVGPCFTLYDFANLNNDLPGLALTEPLRTLIGNGAGAGSLTPALTAHRNCVPSGHTMISVVNAIIAFRLGSRGRWFYAVLGVATICSTVYLRYHYVVDVLAGMACVPLVFALDAFLRSRLRRMGFKNA